MSELRLAVQPDGEAAARAAARHIAECARHAVAERGRFALALSGGSTPRQMLQALTQEKLPWHATHVFQVDERVAPAGDPERNLTQIEEILVAGTALASRDLHPMPVEEADLERAANQYAQILQAQTGAPPVLDLVHLGLGEDGHTASLIPGDSAVDVAHTDVTITRSYHGHRRMTLTIPVLHRTRERLWLVTGESKAPMLARLYRGDRAIPAGRVRREDSVVFADQAATRDLPERISGETDIE